MGRSDEVDLHETDPRRIASIIRSTDDLDLVVHESHMPKAVATLEALTFCRSPRIQPPPVRMRRGRDVIDLIARPAQPRERLGADLESVLGSLALEDACTPLRVGDEDVLVASPDILVVLKAVAWTNRCLEQDLVDIARIALLDRSEGAVARALTERAATLPSPVLSSLRRLHGAFDRDGAPGPAAVANASLAELPGLRFEEERELEIRAFASAAVRAMLEGALER